MRYFFAADWHSVPENGVVDRSRSFLRLDRVLLLFFFLDPFYNLFVYAAFPWVPPNAMTFGLTVSNWYLLAWLVLLTVILIRQLPLSPVRDRFIVWYSVYVAYRIVHDWLLGRPWSEAMAYVPSTILFLVVYMAASRMRVNRWTWSVFATYAILLAMLFGFLEAATKGLHDGRMSSVFGEANFFAFYLFYMFFLLEMLPSRASLVVLGQTCALMGCVLSGTRSVIAVLLLTLILQRRLMLALPLLISALVVLGQDRWDFDNILTMNKRVSIWQQVYDGRAEINLLFGSGTGYIRRAELLPVVTEDGQIQYMQPQSHYVLLLAEVGLVGLCLWGMSLVAMIKSLWPFRQEVAIRAGGLFLLGLLAIQIVECEMFRALPVALLMGILQAQRQAVCRPREPEGRGRRASRRPFLARPMRSV